jgi:hypothetical protein
VLAALGLKTYELKYTAGEGPRIEKKGPLHEGAIALRGHCIKGPVHEGATALRGHGMEDGARATA